MSGPNIQMPGPISEVFDFEYDQDGKIINATMRQPWAALINSLAQTAYNGSRSGATALRPTSSVPGRFIGMSYFDTTLGKPIFLKTASSSAWVLADGTAA